MKRKLEPLLRGGLALLLCLVTILLAANIQAGQPRRQQQDPTSRMLLSDADILYDADGVSRFDGTDNQPTDQNEDTSQEQPPEERDDDLVSTPDQPDDDPSETPSDSAGRTNIGDLLDITGPGGGSGGQTPSREPGKEDGGSQVGDPDR